MVFDPTTGGDTQPQGDQPTAAPMPEEQEGRSAAGDRLPPSFQTDKTFHGVFIETQTLEAQSVL